VDYSSPLIDVQPGDIILAKRHENGSLLRCEGMLLTVSKVEPWGVRAYSQLPLEPKTTGLKSADASIAFFNLGWYDFVMTGGRNPTFDDAGLEP
jgi:hypothetical protein